MNASQGAPAAIGYQLRVARPSEHRAQFTMQVPRVQGPFIDLVLPSWTPGSYQILLTSRSVRGLRASDSTSGNSRRVTRIDKGRWRVDVDGSSELRVDYEVYGHQTDNKGLDVTPDHWFVNAAFCLPYVDGRIREPHELEVDLPDGWKAFTELGQVGDTLPRFRAEDYDELVDSPVDCGRPVELTSVARGIPHRIVLCGAGGNYDPRRLEEDLGRIADTTMGLFGGSPLRRYTWFFHLSPTTEGALEHRASVSAVVARTGFRPASAYREFLLLCAHEYFHLYNVKRLRPAVLGPFDYTRENYTRLLWSMEGLTDYYAHLILRRAGLATPRTFLEGLAKEARRLQQTPGRSVTDLETASLQTWVDFYRPYEETVNQSVSYYLKGALVSLCLDLDVRRRTENQRSLDSVLRHLWTTYAERDRGIGEEELQSAIEAATGLSLGDFFDRYIRGTAELDVGSFVRAAGLELRPAEKPRRPEDDSPPGYLGMKTTDQGGVVRVSSVLDGGPARRAGLSPGDEVIAVNGSKVTFATFGKALESLPPGSEATLTVFRRGWLTTVDAVLGEAPPESLEFRPVPDPTPLERSIYESWAGAPWEPRPPEGSRPGSGDPAGAG